MNFPAILEIAVTNLLLAIMSGVLIALLFWFMERMSPFDECVRDAKDSLTCGIYGGLRLVSWAIMFAAMMR